MDRLTSPPWTTNMDTVRCEGIPICTKNSNTGNDKAPDTGTVCFQDPAMKSCDQPIGEKSVNIQLH